MPPLTTCQPIAVNSIDLADRTYLLRPGTPEPPTPQFINSIARYGILHPPLLYRTGEGHITILSGRRRVRAALDIGWNDIPALLVPATTGMAERLELLLQHALIGSRLSIIEQALLLEKASRWLPEEQVLSLLPILGYRPQPYKVRELAALLTLDRSVIMELHRGTVHPKTGQKLLRLQPADQEEIARLVKALRLGGSKQQKLVDLATELIMRRNRPLREILAEIPGRERGEEKNIPQQAAALLRWMHRACFPRTAAAEDEHRKFCRTLDLPTGVQVEHTAAFEDDRLCLRIDCTDREELRKIWQHLRRLLQKRRHDPNSRN